jgi:precorrin-2 dehydrogenase / sirohydrochlorin ferrochelatase
VSSAGYPVMLHVRGRRCVVVGGGKVATRKVADFLDAGAKVTVISPELSAALTVFAHDGLIEFQQRAYGKEILIALKPFLVVAATDSHEVNRQIADDARTFGALVNCADSAHDSDVISMAALHRGPITIALSTGAISPALAAHLRVLIEDLIGPEYATLAEWLSELRIAARKEIPSEAHRKALWDAILDSDVLDYLRQGDEAAARRIVQDLYADAAEWTL